MQSQSGSLVIGSMNCPLSQLSQPVIGNACKIALIVGTCLNALNQRPLLWQGQSISWGAFALNFAVPFLVPSYSGAKVLKSGPEKH